MAFNGNFIDVEFLDDLVEEDSEKENLPAYSLTIKSIKVKEQQYDLLERFHRGKNDNFIC